MASCGSNNNHGQRDCREKKGFHQSPCLPASACLSASCGGTIDQVGANARGRSRTSSAFLFGGKRAQLLRGHKLGKTLGDHAAKPSLCLLGRGHTAQKPREVGPSSTTAGCLTATPTATPGAHLRHVRHRGEVSHVEECGGRGGTERDAGARDSRPPPWIEKGAAQGNRACIPRATFAVLRGTYFTATDLSGIVAVHLCARNNLRVDWNF